MSQIIHPFSTDDFDSDGSFDSEPEGDPTGTNSADSPDPCSLNSFEAKSPYVGYATVKYEYEGMWDSDLLCGEQLVAQSVRFFSRK